MTIQLPLQWRVRAKSCNPSAKDAFMWAADELDAALKENRETADECRRVLNSDLAEHEKMREIRAIIQENAQSSNAAENPNL